MVRVVHEHLEADRPASAQRVDQLVGEQRRHLVEQPARRAEQHGRLGEVVEGVPHLAVDEQLGAVEANRLERRRRPQLRLGADEVVVEPRLGVLVPRARLAERRVGAPERRGTRRGWRRSSRGARAPGRGRRRAWRRGRPPAGSGRATPPSTSTTCDQRDGCDGGRGGGDVGAHRVAGEHRPVELEVVEHGDQVLGVGPHAERGRQLAGVARARGGPAPPARRPGPSARATPCHDRWLPVIPWAARTTRSPLPHRPTCSDPPATGTSKLEYGSQAPCAIDHNGRALGPSMASRRGLRRWCRRLADRPARRR